MQLIDDIKVSANDMKETTKERAKDIKNSASELLPTFKDIGVAALRNMKSGYFINVVVVFIVAILISVGYNYTLVNNIYQNSDISLMLENHHKTNAIILEEFLEGQHIFDIEISAHNTAETYTKGYFSVIVNEITGTGSIGFGILNGFNKIFFNGRITESISIFIMMFLSVLIMIFLRNIVIVGKCRYFLEQRIYTETGIDRLIFAYRTGAAKNVAVVMLLRSVYQTLWNMTILGGVYKHYEYLMIPYILAENPNIKYTQAFEMSRELMRKEKFNTFKIELSFLPFLLLDGATMHLVTLFFLDPYKECIYSELYSRLRCKKKVLLNDGCLLYDNLLFDNSCGLTAYPDDQCPTLHLNKRRWLIADYNRTYSFDNCVLFFFSFSIIGWVWEVFFYLINEGKFINRGTMFGPWLPIYGLGGLVIIKLLKPLRSNPALLFGAAFVVCGALEYATAWVLEAFFHSKWWDYTGYFCNLHGRICLEGLLVFGLAGVFTTYFIAPVLDNLFNKIDRNTKRTICMIMIVAFIGDFFYSVSNPNVGEGITDNLI